MNKMNNLDKGFTLIELLVVISIIGILVAVSLFGLQGSLESARDTKRKSDLKQYQTALENYANKNNGLFPIHNASVGLTSMCAELSLGAAAANCPEDPLNTGFYGYGYNSDGTGSIYAVFTRIENAATQTFFIICSNGKSKIYPSATGFSSSTCPF